MSGNKPKMKTIQKTSELLSKNLQAKAKGSGKEKEVFGSGVHSLAKGKSSTVDYDIILMTSRCETHARCHQHRALRRGEL